MEELSRKIQAYLAAGKSIWDYFADWLAEVGKLTALRGVTLTIEREHIYLPFESVGNSADGFENVYVRSPQFPGAVFPPGLQHLMAYEGDTAKMETRVLESMSAQTGIAIPPIPVTPEPAAETPTVKSPIGVPHGGGMFGAAVGFNHATVTGTWIDPATSIAYRKMTAATPFGTAIWYVQVN